MAHSYALKGRSEFIEAENAVDALQTLLTPITYGPMTIEEWMEKSRQSHPHISTDSSEAFLEGMIKNGYADRFRKWIYCRWR